MHRIFCLKRTPIQKNNIDICKELHFLSDLRCNGRSALLEHCDLNFSSKQREDDFEDDILSKGTEYEYSPSDKESVRYHENEKAVVVTPEPRELRKILRIIHNSIKMHKKLIRILIDIQWDIDKGNHKKQYLSRLNREKNDFLVSTMKRKTDCSLASLREYHFVHDSSIIIIRSGEKYSRYFCSNRIFIFYFKVKWCVQ